MHVFLWVRKRLNGLWAFGFKSLIGTSPQIQAIRMAAKTNPFTFLQQVRTEVSKVTWPTRRETVVSAIMVFIMVALAGVFFFAIDQLLSWFVGILLSLGG